MAKKNTKTNAYIAYLDMLGTQGFCRKPEEYYQKITTFAKKIKYYSKELGDTGHIGFFSDSAYIECTNLTNMINFLMALRDSLCVERLFFNCALTTGRLGIQDARKNDKEACYFGVIFQDSQIAHVYVEQNRFKGIGIHISEDVKKDMLENEDLRGLVIDNFFLPTPDSLPMNYSDIKIDLSFQDYADYETKMLKSIVDSCLLAYSNSLKHGRYYISILACVINSVSVVDIDWCTRSHKFTNCPLIFETIFNMVEESHELPDVKGIEYLCLLVIFRIYSIKKLRLKAKRDIAETVLKWELFNNKYANDLESIPHFRGYESERDELLAYYHDYLATVASKKVLPNKPMQNEARN